MFAFLCQSWKEVAKSTEALLLLSAKQHAIRYEKKLDNLSSHIKRGIAVNQGP